METTTGIFRYNLVMLIDDSALDKFIANKLIKQTFFAREILFMDSAKAALEYLRSATESSNLPDRILLDISMPQMDGFEFLEQYAKLPGHLVSQCIIMLSSTLNQSDLDRAHRDPYVLTFVTKPLTAERLQML